jgi:hypothetical protein
MPPSSQQRLARLRRRYRQLALSLAEVDFIAKGSVIQRHIPCGKSTCRCHADPPQLHGPYWQWSTAVEGKTVTRSLTEQQARLYQEWIGNRKQLEAILEKMQAIAAEAAELLLAQAQPAPRSRSAGGQPRTPLPPPQQA